LWSVIVPENASLIAGDADAEFSEERKIIESG
jgi:hypothetical protein